MKRVITVGVTVILLAGLSLGAVACSNSNKTSPSTSVAKTNTPPAGTSAAQGAITATLVEYAIQLSKAPGSAGKVTFNVRNIGATKHELVMLKTDLAANALPTKNDGSVDEAAQGVTNVGETGDMAAGDSKPLTVDFQPGHYVLICNIIQTTNGQTVSHYQRGMTAEFTVAL